MTTQLSTYHDLRAIPIIRTFVLETGRFFGANEKECHQLELAAEEAASFILNAFKPDTDEPFVIESTVIDQGLLFRFSNRGMPVDEENMPSYDSQNPGDSIDGLQFFLLENITDALRFQNEGNKGWVLLFEKRFQDFNAIESTETVDEALLEACAKEKLEVGLAKVSDAYDIVKLTYLTYRYSYVKSSFYYRKELESMIENGKVIAFVARNHKGEVVVNSAYLRSSSCDAIAEAGMLMSRPEYRKNRALLRVTRMVIDYLKKGNDGLRVTYSNLVTAHTKSQQLVTAYRFVPMAIKLSVHEQAEFVGIETDETHRESLLYALLAPHGFDLTTIYVPSEHQKMTQTLVQDFDTITISTDSAEPSVALTDISVTKEESDRLATIVIDRFGKDWLTQLHQNMRELDADGYITIHLRMNADTPLPPSFEASLMKLDFFYCGILIKSMQCWELLYTALQGQRFDFDTIALSDERAKVLKNYMYDNYKRVGTLV